MGVFLFVQIFCLCMLSFLGALMLHVLCAVGEYQSLPLKYFFSTHQTVCSLSIREAKLLYRLQICQPGQM